MDRMVKRGSDSSLCSKIEVRMRLIGCSNLLSFFLFFFPLKPRVFLGPIFPFPCLLLLTSFSSNSHYSNSLSALGSSHRHLSPPSPWQPYVFCIYVMYLISFSMIDFYIYIVFVYTFWLGGEIERMRKNRLLKR